jgi:tetratricopeptide (TPR) repeat protein
MRSRTRRVLGSFARVVTFLVVALVSVDAIATSSADELVHQAQAHELAREPDVAARRYMEALSVDPSHAAAWLGLGALRLKLDDAAEAERVYNAALRHLPSLAPAMAGRARARWRLGQHRAAELDMETYAAGSDDADAVRELSSWYATDGRLPAQLALWRRRLASVAQRNDRNGVREARTIVLALMVLVDGADPVTRSIEPDATRIALAAIARRCFADRQSP